MAQIVFPYFYIFQQNLIFFAHWNKVKLIYYDIHDVETM